MDLFTRNHLKILSEERGGPCVSLLMPTHRGGAEADPIRWRNHLRQIENLLTERRMRAPQARTLLEPLQRLLEEPLFWKYQADGLAAYLAPRFLRLYRVPLPLNDIVTVAERFHVKPLLPLVSGGRFFILALSQNGVRLLEGTEQRVGEIDLTGVPRNLAEALAAHDSDEMLNFHTHPAAGFGYKGAIFHGQGVGIDTKKDDLSTYFHKIDHGLHHVLRTERAPLVLAGVDYLLPLYRQANTYPHLVANAIVGNPDRTSNEQLHRQAWPLVRPWFEEAERDATSLYRQLAGTGRNVDMLEQVLPAADRGEVETLFVAVDQQVWGRFEPVGGVVEVHDQEEPGDEELLNRAALATLAHGKTVYALPSRRIPDFHPVAAILCLPLVKHGKGA